MNFRFVKRLAAILLLIAAPLASGADPLPSNSIYQLGMPLTAQDGRTTQLDLYRGNPVLITMFYASCPAICPTLIEQVRLLEQTLPVESRARLRVLMVSFDPVRDSPAKLDGLAKLHHADLSRWTFARASASDVRALAAALGIQYRQLPNGDFDHSTVISLLDRDGRVLTRSTSLARTEEDLGAALRQATAAP